MVYTTVTPLAAPGNVSANCGLAAKGSVVVVVVIIVDDGVAVVVIIATAAVVVADADADADGAEATERALGTQRPAEDVRVQHPATSAVCRAAGETSRQHSFWTAIASGRVRASVDVLLLLLLLLTSSWEWWVVRVRLREGEVTAFARAGALAVDVVCVVFGDGDGATISSRPGRAPADTVRKKSTCRVGGDSTVGTTR
jgi:hypothetical protein